MRSFLPSCIALGVVAWCSAAASCQTVYAWAQVLSPTSASQYNGVPGGHVNVSVSTMHWVNVTAAGANQNYYFHGDLDWGISGVGGGGYVSDNLFSVHTNADGNGMSSYPPMEYCSPSVPVVDGAVHWTAFADTSMTDWPQGFTVNSTHGAPRVDFIVYGEG